MAKHRFFGNYPSEKLSPHGKNYKIHLIFFSKLVCTKTNSKLEHFSRFQPKTRHMIFLSTDDKFRQGDIMTFYWLNRS